MNLIIHSNIEGKHAIAMLGSLTLAAGGELTIAEKSLDDLDGEYDLDALYVDGQGLVLTLKRKGDGPNPKNEGTLDA